jgi:hypothetical protein
MARIVGENNERDDLDIYDGRENQNRQSEMDSHEDDPLYKLWREIDEERRQRNKYQTDPQDREASIPTDISGQVDTSSGDMYHGIDEDDIAGGLSTDMNAARHSEDDPTP